MTILKSKAFWSFTAVSGGIGSVVAFDRYESARLRQNFLDAARVYGSEPLLPHQQPRRLSFFLVSPDAEHRRACLVTLKRYALEILTAAGVDYCWVLQVDAQEAKVKWDEAAQEANKPELMTEEGKSALNINDLFENILKPQLNSNSSDDSKDDKVCWKSLREKYAAVPLGIGSDGFVCFDQTSFNRLQFELQNLKQPAVAETPAKGSWWKRASSPPLPLPPKITPENVKLYFIPCDWPQSPLARLQRFLFGQREMTRTIGEAVLKCIRQEQEQ